MSVVGLEAMSTCQKCFFVWINAQSSICSPNPTHAISQHHGASNPLRGTLFRGILVEAERFLGEQYPFSIELDPNKGNFHLWKKLFMQQTPFRLLIYYWRCNILQDWVDSTMGNKGEDCRITHGSWIWLKYWTSFCRTRSIESDSTTSSLAAFEFAYQSSWLLARLGIHQDLFNYRWEDLSARY